MKQLTFLIYIIFWDGGIIGLFSYEVFIKGHSGWWFVLAYILVSASFKPRHFGIEEKPKLEE